MESTVQKNFSLILKNLYKLISIIVDSIKFLCVAEVYALMSMGSLFVATKEKDVEGQVVLVSEVQIIIDCKNCRSP